MNRRIAGLVTVLLVAAACAFGDIWADYGDPVRLQPSDVVGTWHSPDDRLFVFAADGTFTATNLPPSYFERWLPRFVDPPDSIDGSGSWRTEPPLEDAGPQSGVWLGFDRLGGYRAALSVRMTSVQVDGETFLLFLTAGGWVAAYHVCTKCLPPVLSPRGPGPAREPQALATPTGQLMPFGPMLQ